MINMLFILLGLNRPANLTSNLVSGIIPEIWNVWEKYFVKKMYTTSSKIVTTQFVLESSKNRVKSTNVVGEGPGGGGLRGLLFHEL